jgi:hypothetical protein
VGDDPPERVPVAVDRDAVERSWREALAILTDLAPPDATARSARLAAFQARSATR